MSYGVRITKNLKSKGLDYLIEFSDFLRFFTVFDLSI